MEPYREPFTVRAYDVDAFGVLAVPALSAFLDEAAGQHATRLGVGIETLQAQGVTWVLARRRIVVSAAIRQGDALVVETWPAGIDRLAAFRDFRVHRGGVEVARGSTTWFVLDLATRRPVRPEQVLDPRFPRPRSEPLLPDAPAKLPGLDAWTFQKRFHIRYADIDVNQHVNNASYVAWALEAIPREVWESSRLATLDVAYLAEGLLGSAILSRLGPAGEGAFSHVVVREEDEKELARVTTTWVRREGASVP
jgi:medium-chain acyl-[acyl-carrier-protein] hydrolase